MYVRFQSSSVVTSSTLSERTLMLLTTPGFSPPWTNEASPSAAAATSTCLMLLRTFRLQERPLLELVVGLPELLLRVHHDRAVPGDRLLERLPRHQEEP